ncbi:cellulase family glycosylhydrolase [Agriterribacter sp.]|uniref:cellulase family glycosylhydrolase n=1 Tax=Agriterribacter sp. TaxID=2821509 RepID=UPI002B95AAEF|nr:cellulase family glycosylhydrolase [Agriterribacter sp.]HTN06281.1 cellulase family glycosylhydrolase [Agriterribacter sp.]
MKFRLIVLSTLLFSMGFQQCKPKEEKKADNEEVAIVRNIWTKEQANNWYAKQEWLVGCDFVPSTAINQLEMWQAATFDTATINRELGWAASLGMNTVRVYLHDLLYQQDAEGFLQRMDEFLQIASRHHIKPLFVLFDSVWDPFPKLGTQREPKPGVHNSGWVQNPGKEALLDSVQYPRLETYVKGVVEKFASDDRVLGWDVWNEPENMNNEYYRKMEPPNKADIVLVLLKEAFEWARSVNPQQPLTAGLWSGNWSAPEKLKPIETLMVEESDVISFHNYDSAASFEKNILELQRYGRPILCTEYMARGNNSTFEGSLPLAKKHNVAAYNWGLVDGKSQTIYPWDSWKKAYNAEPEVWFHDIFKKDGTPYRKAETDLIKKLTGKL